MSSNDTVTTFIDACLAGHAFEEDVDRWVERWHDAPEGSAIAALELSEYLGMKAEEYALWVEQPSSLRFVIAARRRGKRVDEMLTSRDDYALAARAQDPQDARTVLLWLVNTGRVDPERAVHS